MGDKRTPAYIIQATTVVNHLIYDAFGRLTSETSPAVDSLFLFTARPFDQDTQLQNNLNRWYDARVGRWLSEDPVGYPLKPSLPLFIGSNTTAAQVNLYAYVNNNPLSNVDSTGRIGHKVGGTLIGCGAGVLYSGVHSILVGDSFCQGCCKATISCLFGALGGAVAAAAPGYEGCIVGFVSGIAESASKQLCHYVCGHGENADFTCAVATAIVNGAVGCLVEGMAEAEPTPAGEKVAKWAWQILSRRTGYDIYQICYLTSQPAPPPAKTFACCTFEHNGVWWSESVECGAGQAAQAACASRADGRFIDWKVVFARPGTRS